MFIFYVPWVVLGCRGHNMGSVKVKSKFTKRTGTASRSTTHADNIDCAACPSIPPIADCELVFWNAEELCKNIFAMLPKGNKLDFVHSIKNMRAEICGSDRYLSHFLKILGALLEQCVKYGTPMPDGTVRYTSNTNGGPLFVYVKDGKIVRLTPIEFDEDDAPVWTVEVRGKKFSPPRKTTVTSYSQCLKSCNLFKRQNLISHDTH